MTNEEMERIMNYMIVRQEEFAEQMAKQQALNSHMQQIMLSVVESQQRNTVDIANLASIVDRLVEAMPRSSNGKDNR